MPWWRAAPSSVPETHAYLSGRRLTEAERYARDVAEEVVFGRSRVAYGLLRSAVVKARVDALVAQLRSGGCFV